MTVTAPVNAAGMIHSRRADSEAKRGRVRAALERMLSDGTPVTFAAVARAAGVSTWLVYAPGVREAIDEARTHQTAGSPAGHQPDTVTTQGLETDLALARAEIRKLRAERDQQQHQLRRVLGSRMDDIATADLVARIDELTRRNNELAAAATHHHRDTETLHTRIRELEDNLTAARTSLRRMIRTENLPPTQSGS